MDIVSAESHIWGIPEKLGCDSASYFAYPKTCTSFGLGTENKLPVGKLLGPPAGRVCQLGAAWRTSHPE